MYLWSYEYIQKCAREHRAKNPGVPITTSLMMRWLDKQRQDVQTRRLEGEEGGCILDEVEAWFWDAQKVVVRRVVPDAGPAIGKWQPDQGLDIDHIIPRRDGGMDDPVNFMFALPSRNRGWANMADGGAAERNKYLGCWGMLKVLAAYLGAWAQQRPRVPRRPSSQPA